MDMMTIRKMVMGQMTQGAQFVKGTFTVPDTGTSYGLNFGKTFSKYLFIIEATDESKATIMASGYDSNKAYAFLGIFPKLSIDNVNAAFNGVYSRINPSTSATNGLLATNVVPYDSSISFSINSLVDGSSVLFRGLTYNYYIAEIK